MLKVNETFKFKNELHLVTGFQTYSNGDTGVETVRFIKSRNAWAKVPQFWTTLETMAANDQFKA